MFLRRVSSVSLVFFGVTGKYVLFPPPVYFKYLSSHFHKVGLFENSINQLPGFYGIDLLPH